MLESWTKEGEPRVIGKKYGKFLQMQDFRNPQTGELEEFALFGQKDWSVILAVTDHGDVLVVRQYKQGWDQA